MRNLIGISRRLLDMSSRFLINTSRYRSKYLLQVSPEDLSSRSRDLFIDATHSVCALPIVEKIALEFDRGGALLRVLCGILVEMV